MSIIVALLLFTVIIVIHELGHFLLAKKNGVGVTEFSVGMGPRLVTIVKTKGGFTCKFLASQKYCETRQDWNNITKYSLKLLPIGGSCMMVGEDEVSDRKDSFNQKGVWARISVIAAGPIFNFILAFVLAMIIIGSLGYHPAKVSEVKTGTSAETEGIQEGDIITNINGYHVDIGSDVSVYLQLHPLDGSNVKVTYKHNGEKKEAVIDPHYSTYRLGFGYYSGSDTDPAIVTSLEEEWPFAKAGIQVGDKIIAVGENRINSNLDLREYMDAHPLTAEPLDVTYERDGVSKTVTVTPKLYNGYSLGFGISSERIKTGPLGVIKYGYLEVKFYIKTTIKSLGSMIAGKVSKNDIAGPVGIVSMIGDAYENSKPAGIGMILLNMFYYATLLSANLGVMNLLPLPALDGGRLVFLLIEAIRGKAINPEKEGMVHLVGLAALMLLMIFVMFNDISKLLG